MHVPLVLVLHRRAGPHHATQAAALARGAPVLEPHSPARYPQRRGRACRDLSFLENTSFPAKTRNQPIISSTLYSQQSNQWSKIYPRAKLFGAPLSHSQPEPPRHWLPTVGMLVPYDPEYLRQRVREIHQCAMICVHSKAKATVDCIAVILVVTILYKSIGLLCIPTYVTMPMRIQIQHAWYPDGGMKLNQF